MAFCGRQARTRAERTRVRKTRHQTRPRRRSSARQPPFPCPLTEGSPPRQYLPQSTQCDTPLESHTATRVPGARGVPAGRARVRRLFRSRRRRLPYSQQTRLSPGRQFRRRCFPRFARRLRRRTNRRRLVDVSVCENRFCVRRWVGLRGDVARAPGLSCLRHCPYAHLPQT